MNYSWNWGVLFEHTGIGNELYIHWMITGVGWLLLIGSIAWAIAMVIGTIFGIMRTLPNKTARSIGTAYVTFFRNIPLLVQLFFWFYVAPGWLTPAIQDWWYRDLSPNTSAMLSASIGLGLFTAARIVEQVRTGIESLPEGQINAAYALGFTIPQAYKEVLLPQAFRVILPPLSSELTNCFKNASVASLVGVMELISQTKTISEYTQNSLEIYTYATIIYLVFNLSLIAIMGLIERKLRVPGLIAGGQKMSMMTELATAYPGLMGGMITTMKVLFLAIVGGISLGTVLALMRLSGIKALEVPAKLYVNYFRSVPLLLVLLWFYFAVPMIYFWIAGKYLQLDAAFASCVVAFMMFEAAYFSEVVRAGIQSIGSGQVNAAKALGMTYGQTMRLVILPQAFRKMLPLILQQCIILFQDTTLVFAIGLTDFFRAAYVRGELMGLLTPYILGAGAVYFIISLAASIGVQQVQKRLRF